MLEKVRKEWKEPAAFILAKMLLGVGAGVLALLAVAIVSLVFMLLGGALVFLTYSISKTTAAVLAIPVFLLYILATLMVTAPIPVFFTEYVIQFYKSVLSKA